MKASGATEASSRILISVTGNSPAVLTETVWALAHEEKPWIPDQVVVITTSVGKAAVERDLLDQDGWSRLCAALEKKSLPVQNRLAFGASDSIRVIGDGRHDFSDITTQEQSDAAADFILGVLRQYTEQPDTEIIASIAGGRKTMSALMMACISLLGREDDRLCHVLVNDPFDRPLNPPFLFPEQGVKHMWQGEKIPSTKARIQLCEIPFVRVRGLYRKEFGKDPVSYRNLVSQFRSDVPEAVVEPPVVLNWKKGIMAVDGEDLHLRSLDFLVALTFLQFKKENPDVALSITELLGQIKERYEELSQVEWQKLVGKITWDVASASDDIRRSLSRVRGEVKNRVGEALAKRLMPDVRQREYRYKSLQIKPGRLKTS